MKKMALIWMLKAFSVLTLIVSLHARADEKALPRYFLIHEDSNGLMGFSAPTEMVNWGGAWDAVLNLFRMDMHDQRFPDPSEPYNRGAHFGSSWVNDPRDKDCYNTRAKVLMRDSTTPAGFGNTNRCRVERGTWPDPYTNVTYTSADDIQIDHLVPLKHAYITGAFRWQKIYRCLYANYMGNDYHLLSVNGRQNMSKSDRAPNEWMPPARNFHCAYLSIWLKTKLIWGLVLSDQEVESIVAQARDLNCDSRWFAMSKRELTEQRQVIVQNLDLCSRRASVGE